MTPCSRAMPGARWLDMSPALPRFEAPWKGCREKQAGCGGQPGRADPLGVVYSPRRPSTPERDCSGQGWGAHDPKLGSVLRPRCGHQNPHRLRGAGGGTRHTARESWLGGAGCAFGGQVLLQVGRLPQVLSPAPQGGHQQEGTGILSAGWGGQSPLSGPAAGGVLWLWPWGLTCTEERGAPEGPRARVEPMPPSQDPQAAHGGFLQLCTQTPGRGSQSTALGCPSALWDQQLDVKQDPQWL